MKKVVLSKISFYKLYKKDYLNLLEQNDLEELEAFSDRIKHHLPECTVYKLRNGNVFLDQGNRRYIFKCSEDAQFFLDVAIAEILKENKKIDRFSEAPNFTEELSCYIDDFEKRYGVPFNFAELETVRQLDNLVNSGKVNLDVEYLSVVAIVGAFFTGHIRKAKWRNTIVGDNRSYPEIVFGDIIFSPVAIVEHEMEMVQQNKKIYFHRPIAAAIRKIMDGLLENVDEQ